MNNTCKSPYENKVYAVSDQPLEQDVTIVIDGHFSFPELLHRIQCNLVLFDSLGHTSLEVASKHGNIYPIINGGLNRIRLPDSAFSLGFICLSYHRPDYKCLSAIYQCENACWPHIATENRPKVRYSSQGQTYV